MTATIDETIVRVEQLYSAVTGQRPPALEGTSAPIPPESDPVVHVETQLERIATMLEELVPLRPQTSTWVPRAVAWRDEAGLLLAVDLPGVTRDQIEIRLGNGVLTVSGQRRTPWSRILPPSGVEGCDVPFGSFARSFPVGANVVTEHVGANVDNGVLTIRIGNKRGDASQIQIKS